MSSPNNNINDNTATGNKEKGVMQNLVDSTKGMLIGAKNILTFSEPETDKNIESHDHTMEDAGRKVDQNAAVVKDNAHSAKDHAHEGGERLEDKSKATKEVAKDRLGNVINKAENKVHSFKQDLSEAEQQAKEKRENTGSSIGSSNDQFQSNSRATEDRIKDQPVTKDMTNNAQEKFDSHVHEPNDVMRNERHKVPSTLDSLLSSPTENTQKTNDTTAHTENQTKDKMNQFTEDLHQAGEKAEHKTKKGVEHAREWVHDKTKSKEQKEAEKPIGQKVDEATPDSAQEAGAKIGSKIDEGYDNIKSTFEQQHAQ